MLNNITINAGQTIEFFEPGDFFRVMEAASSIDLIFYRNGAEVARAEGVVAGYAERFRGEGFDRYRITSATTQTLQFVARQGADVSYDKAPTGAITLTAPVEIAAEAFTQAQKTVTTASASLLAANANRRYFFVQNNDATGIVYITLDGTAATTAKGIRILPGESFECASPAPNGQIFAIGSIASNTNVVAVEG